MSLNVQVLAMLSEKIFGRKARMIMEYLIEKGEATDEQVAKHFNIDVNEARRILNDLFEERLLRYRRARDEKIGWYIYFWRVTEENPVVILEARRRRALSILRQRLEYEKNNTFYICPKCERKYTFDEAIDNSFRCIECGSLLEPLDNSKIIKTLEEAIRKLEEYNPFE